MGKYYFLLLVASHLTASDDENDPLMPRDSIVVPESA